MRVDFDIQKIRSYLTAAKKVHENALALRSLLDQFIFEFAQADKRLRAERHDGNPRLFLTIPSILHHGLWASEINVAVDVAVVMLNQPAQNEVRLVLFDEETDEHVTSLEQGVDMIRTHLTYLCEKYRVFDLFENQQ